MGFLRSLFSTDEIIKTATKGVYDGLDMAFFTEEEKSKAEQIILNWKLEYYKATAPQNMSRRYIAVIITALWAALIILTTGLGVFGLKEQAELVFSVLKDIVLQPFSIVIGFYFLAHITGKFSKNG